MPVDLGGSAVFSVGAAAGDVLVGAAAAPGPHWAFWNSFQLMPLNVLAVCAARYLTLHSCILNAWAGMFQVIATATAVARCEWESIDMSHELHGCVACERHGHDRPALVV